jgi:hypothetical protein
MSKIGRVQIEEASQAYTVRKKFGYIPYVVEIDKSILYFVEGKYLVGGGIVLSGVIPSRECDKDIKRLLSKGNTIKTLVVMLSNTLRDGPYVILDTNIPMVGDDYSVITILIAKADK